jgi:four helix bundle protein
MAQDFHDLIVWQRAIDLTLSMYIITHSFPPSEIYGLTSQMRRASVSIASNIAEGRGRLNPAEFRQFLGLAQGSLFELKTQLLIAQRLGLVSPDSFSEAECLSNEVSKMLRTFVDKLSKDLSSRGRELSFRAREKKLMAKS